MSWKAWELDWFTVAWIVWLVAFVVLESLAVLWFQGQALTAHVRPPLVEHPLTWFIGLGAWLWLGMHFLAPKIEANMFDSFVR